MITGGSRGLGRNAALHLGRAGVGIVLTYRSQRDVAEETLAALRAEGVTAETLPLDTGDTRSFPAFAEALTETLERTWGRTTFGCLVNNAGHGMHKGFAALLTGHTGWMTGQRIEVSGGQNI